MRMKILSRLKIVFVLLVIGFLGYSYGFLSYRLKLPPYTLFMKTYLSALELKNQDHSEQDVDDSRYVSKEGVEKKLQIRDASGAGVKRVELIEILWGESGKPVRTQLSYTENIHTDRYGGLTALTRVDALTVVMDYEIESKLHLLHPSNTNGELIIYHQGHGGDFIEGKKLIGQLLESGFTVVGAAMPLLGLNNNPVVDLPGLGLRSLVEHNQLPFLAVQEGIAVKYFVEPIVVLINYLSAEKDYSAFHMVGISGGGWTTTLAAAVDERIKNSFSVAGTEPLIFSDVLPTEYEQVTPELFSRVSYFDLYLLSAFGQERSHIQVHNAYDPCCNRGKNVAIYEETLKRRALEIGGGEFGVVIDETHAEHKISSFVADYILEKLANSTPLVRQ